VGARRNSLLPKEIAVQWATPVPGDFHARYSALSRSYRYVLYNHPVRPALFAGRTGWFICSSTWRGCAKPPIPGRRARFFQLSVRGVPAKSPVRIIQGAGIRASGAYFLFDFTANAFLHHMVRNIVGCLVYVGKGSIRRNGSRS